MSSFIDNFHFVRPGYFFALLPAIAIFFLMLQQYRKNTQWTRLIDSKLLPYLIDGKFTKAKKFPLYALLFIWVISCLGLAGPTWEKKSLPIQKDLSAMVILWDMSPSMDSKDLKPSRLIRSRLKLVDLLNARKEGLTALVAYAGDAHVVTPLTDDTKTIKSLLPGLGPSVMPEQGSDAESAFEMAHTLLKETGVTEGNIVFVTDGISPNAFDSLWATASESQHRVTIWGFGSTDGAPIPLPNGGFARNNQGEIVVAKLNHDLLSDAAIKMGGVYIPFSNNNNDIENIQQFGTADYGQQESDQAKFSEQWLEQGHWLVLFLLPIAALLFRRGWLLCIALFFVDPQESQALSWTDLWQTKDQQGQQLLQNDNAEAAAETFEDPKWKAIANYKAGKFEDAEKLFEKNDDATSHYNAGNALTQQGKYDDAIAAYDRAIAERSVFDDAKHNRDIAEQLKKLEQQQQQQDGGDQNQDQDQQGDSKDDQSKQDQGGQQKSDQEQESDEQNSEKSDQKNDQQQSDNQQENAQGEEQQTSDEQKEDLEKHYQQKPPEDNDKESEEQNAHLEPNGEEESTDEQQQRASIAAMTDEQKEQQQALDQWLRKVPDDPSGLLRNKFKYENQLRRRESIRGSKRTDEQRW